MGRVFSLKKDLFIGLIDMVILMVHENRVDKIDRIKVDEVDWNCNVDHSDDCLD